MMRLAIIGTGYVGLVTGACLADLGHDIVCIDKNQERIASLRRGEVPFFEPGLQDLVASGMSKGNLHFMTEIDSVFGSDAVFIAVGTPPRPEDGQADLSSVFAVAREITERISGFVVIVSKSTVPVGTGDEIERIVASKANPGSFSVVSNPEFLREGSAIQDFLNPDRIVAGTSSSRAMAVMREIYRPLTDRGIPFVGVARRTSELSKYAGNAFLAMKVAYINEMADLCERTGADVQDIAHILGLDSRIGSKFLRAGPGFGGSCFPKDTLSLIKTARDLESPLQLIETTISVNGRRQHTMVSKIVAACDGDVKGKVIAVWGMTFKPDTDDMRESPALPIIQSLVRSGAIVRAFDPEGMDNARQMATGAIFCESQYDAAEGADAVVLITDWNTFRNPDYARLGDLMRIRVIVDLRNALSPDDARKHGFAYFGIGLGAEIRAHNV